MLIVESRSQCFTHSRDKELYSVWGISSGADKPHWLGGDGRRWFSCHLTDTSVVGVLPRTRVWHQQTVAFVVGA